MVRRLLFAFPKRFWWSWKISNKFPGLLSKYTKDKSSSLSGYSARVCFRKLPFFGCGYRGKGDIYWDAPFGIVLFYNRSPVGSIGFFIKGKRIIVNQIQGVRGSSELLRCLRWERLLLRLIIECAGSLGYRTVEVQPSRKNEWIRFDRKESFKLRYDITATREGLRSDPEVGAYVLAL